MTAKSKTFSKNGGKCYFISSEIGTKISVALIAQTITCFPEFSDKRFISLKRLYSSSSHKTKSILIELKIETWTWTIVLTLCTLPFVKQNQKKRVGNVPR